MCLRWGTVEIKVLNLVYMKAFMKGNFSRRYLLIMNMGTGDVDGLCVWYRTNIQILIHEQEESLQKTDDL